MQTNIAAVRGGVMSADEARAEIGLDPRGGEANSLRRRRLATGRMALATARAIRRALRLWPAQSHDAAVSR